RRLMTLLLVLVALLGAQTVVRAQGDGQFTTHTVQAGETLTSVASQYNTTVELLAEMNGLTAASFLTAGQILIVPQVSDAQMAQPTASAQEFPTAGPPPVETGEVVHTVSAGETLFRIALQYNTTA